MGAQVHAWGEELDSPGSGRHLLRVYVSLDTGDTILTELPVLDDRTKQSCFDRLLTWSDKNDMGVNFNKTKEMVMAPPSLTSNLPLIHISTGHIKRPNYTGLYLDSNLTWHTHNRHPAFQVNAAIILSKTTRPIACRRSPNTVTTLLFKSYGLSSNMQPPSGITLLPKRRQTKLKPYKRAIRIIYTCTNDMPYVSATFVADFSTMSDRSCA